MPIVFELRDEFIRLDQLLKVTGLCHSGGFAHAEVEAGRVRVDGVAESRRRAKLRAGQCVDYAGETIALVAKKEP